MMNGDVEIGKAFKQFTEASNIFRNKEASTTTTLLIRNLWIGIEWKKEEVDDNHGIGGMIIEMNGIIKYNYNGGG